MNTIEQKYIDLAELLKDVISESSPYEEVADEIPQSLVFLTAAALQEAFEEGQEKPDEEGRLYNIYLVDNYGGFYDDFLSKKLDQLVVTKEKEQQVRTLAKSLYEAFEKDSWGMIEPRLFKHVAEDTKSEDEDVQALFEVLSRVKND